MAKATPESEPEGPRLRSESGQNLRDTMQAMNNFSPGGKAANAPQSDADEDFSKQPPIIRLANAIIVNSIESSGTEILLERVGSQALVRLRAHGLLREIMSMPDFIWRPLYQRYCIMADIPFWKVGNQPQSGVILIRHNDNDYRLRLTTLPAAKGPSLCLRIFDDRLPAQSDSDTGFRAGIDFAVSALAAPTPGVFILAAPRSEGKTTTAFQILWRLKDADLQIGIVADRISYTLPGATQVFLHGQYGQIPFTDAVDSLRQRGTDILFLDDIESPEKAEAALLSAESGMNVLITVTANDSAGAIERLLRLGIAPSRLAAVLRGVIHQLLVNRICPHCVVPDDKSESAPNPSDDREDVPSFHGAGCDHCDQTGLRRRIVAFEMRQIAPYVREALNKNLAGAELRYELERGIFPLENDLKEKVRGGVTPLSEAKRVRC